MAHPQSITMVGILQPFLAIHLLTVLYHVGISEAVAYGCSNVCDFKEWGKDARCQNRNLDDIPQECRHAKTLQMQNNQVSTLSRGTFTNFTCLKYLYLDHNNLTVESGAFDGCAMLQKVHLSENNVPVLDKDILQGLPGVIAMFIDEVGMRDVQSMAFGDMLRLTYLSLKRNKLTTPPCDAFQSGNSLKTLDLSSNKISKLPDKCFEENRNLTKLYLKNNPLIDPNALAFWGLDKLEVLDLQYTNLTRVPTGIFQHTSNTKRLYLSYNRITYLFSRDFVGLSGLTHLYLQSNGLINIHPQAFEFLLSIHTLDLAHNSITSIGAGALDNFRDLRDLRLHNNQLNSTKNISFSSISTEATIHLARNPLHCDCAIYPLQDWLKRTDDASENQDDHMFSQIARCSSPRDMAGTPVIEVHILDICKESRLLPETANSQPSNKNNLSQSNFGMDTPKETPEGNASPVISDVQLIAVITAGIALCVLCIGCALLYVMRARINRKTANPSNEKGQGDDIKAVGTNVNIIENPVPPLPPRDIPMGRSAPFVGGTGSLYSGYQSINGDDPLQFNFPAFSRHSSFGTNTSYHRTEQNGITYSSVLPDDLDRESNDEQLEEEEELSPADWVKQNMSTPGPYVTSTLTSHDATSDASMANGNDKPPLYPGGYVPYTQC